MLSFHSRPGVRGATAPSAFRFPRTRVRARTGAFRPPCFLPALGRTGACLQPHASGDPRGGSTRIPRRGQACIVAVASIDGRRGAHHFSGEPRATPPLLGAGEPFLIDGRLSEPRPFAPAGPLKPRSDLGEVLRRKGQPSSTRQRAPFHATGLMSCPTRSPRGSVGRGGHLPPAGEVFWTLARAPITASSFVDTQPLAASADVAAMLPGAGCGGACRDWGRTTPAALAEATANEPVTGPQKSAGVALNRTRHDAVARELPRIGSCRSFREWTAAERHADPATEHRNRPRKNPLSDISHTPVPPS